MTATIERVFINKLNLKKKKKNLKAKPQVSNLPLNHKQNTFHKVTKNTYLTGDKCLKNTIKNHMTVNVLRLSKAVLPLIFYYIYTLTHTHTHI